MKKSVSFLLKDSVGYWTLVHVQSKTFWSWAAPEFKEGRILRHLLDSVLIFSVSVLHKGEPSPIVSLHAQTLLENDLSIGMWLLGYSNTNVASRRRGKVMGGNSLH